MSWLGVDDDPRLPVNKVYNAKTYQRANEPDRVVRSCLNWMIPVDIGDWLIGYLFFKQSARN